MARKTRTTNYLADFRTCRFCGEDELHLVKYGTRAYAHAACLLDAKGEAAFDLLSLCALENFPALIADDFGLYGVLTARINARRAEVA